MAENGGNMDVLRERVSRLEGRVDTHDLVLWGNPETGVKGVLARFDEFSTRWDERSRVEAAHHEEMKEIQKEANERLNRRLTVIGIFISLILVILSWFTYQDAKSRLGNFLIPQRPGRSSLRVPGFEASIHP